MALALKSVDQIQSCDHSNETSLVVCSHGAICFSKFCKMKIWEFLSNFCLWSHLALKGLKPAYDRREKSNSLC